MSPAAAALTKAVALVDMQRRDDVGGDADGLATAIENSWGLPNGTIARAQHFSVGASGPLLRYAINPDKGLASLSLPVHLARCISTFSGTQTREDYGPDVAMDWTRNRVAAEFIYYRAIRLEALSWTSLADKGPPGDPSLDLSRPELLVFRPMPCSGFSVTPASFAVELSCEVPRRIAPLPERHLIAVEAAIAADRQVVEKLSDIPAEKLVVSRSLDVVAPPTSALSAAAVRVEQTVKAGRVRGKTSVAVLRAAMYNTLMKLVPDKAITMYMTLKYVRAACAEMNLDISHYALLRSLGKQISEAVQSIHHNMAEEASFHGSSLEDWWEDALSVMPLESRPPENNTSGWCVVMAWMLLNHPTEKWLNLERGAGKALMAKVLRAELREMRTRSNNTLRERIRTAGQAVLQHMAQKFVGFYGAMWKVYQVLSDATAFVGKTPHEKKLAKERMKSAMPSLKLGALMWQFRGRFLRSLHLEELEGAPSTTQHKVIRTARGSYVLKAVPYRRYAALRHAIELDRLLSGTVLKWFPAAGDKRVNVISTWLRTLPTPLAPVERGTPTRLLRYIINPRLLAENLENDMMLIADDVRSAMLGYEEMSELAEDPTMQASPEPGDWNEDSEDEWDGTVLPHTAAASIAAREDSSSEVREGDAFYELVWPESDTEDGNEEKTALQTIDAGSAMGSLAASLSRAAIRTRTDDDGVSTYTYWDLAMKTEDAAGFVDGVEESLTAAQLDELASLRFVNMDGLMNHLRMRVPEHPMVVQGATNALK